MLKRLQRIDDKILEKIIKLHTPFRNKVMVVITSLGNMGIIWFALCLPFFLMVKWRGVGVNIVMGLSIAHIMGEGIIKHVVCRSRPCHRFDDDEQIINKPKYYSFPSGHSTASFAVVAVVMLRCDFVVWVPVLIMACLIAFSRLYLRVHYLTDVVVGAALGFLCGCTSVALFTHFFAKFFANYNLL